MRGDAKINNVGFETRLLRAKYTNSIAAVISDNVGYAG